jgi:iron complex outermembrane recepter protein
MSPFLRFFPGRSLRPFLLGALLLLAGTTHAADVTSLSGTVSNSNTGDLLEGAKIELPQLGLTALTDTTGRFTLLDVPAGTHDVVVTYIGLDPVRASLTVTAGERLVRNFDLTTNIYQLQAFKVTGDREGAAAAITAQRNADNVKNIVAMDSFGNLPNRSPGEVAIRLPGVAGNLDAEGNVTSLVIRGIGPNLNSVTMDNTIMASEGGASRQFPMSILTGALFDQVELIKGHTPDKSASSMGGTLNLKTRSALRMAEKRRFNYSIAGRLAPAFTEQIPIREDHRFHPLINGSYQEIFSVLGGQRNLGVVFNGFYSENVAGMFRTTRDFENTTQQPAYVWDYRTQDIFNNRKQLSGNLKIEYRLSAATKIYVSGLAGSNDEPFERRYETRAFTNQTAPNATTSGVVPGYTNRITQVRGIAASTIDVTNAQYAGWNQQLRNAGIGAEHEFGRWQIDYDGLFSSARVLSTRKHDGQLIMRLTGVGWILDRTKSDLYPEFIQTEGPDMNNPANYRPAANGLNDRNDGSYHRIRELRGNARYALPTAVPLFVKTGVNWRQQTFSRWNKSRRWNYIGTGPLPADDGLVMFDRTKTGRMIPQWQADTFIKGGNPVTPALWDEDRYFYESTRYTGTNSVTETVKSAYIMAQGKLGREGILSRTGFLTGVRTEDTEMESWGWVRTRTPASNAQRLADPAGAARAEYDGNRRSIEGSYRKSFPSIHLTHDVTPNLKARLSWSTNFGRPALSTALPNESVNETAQTLTINNPSLLPQMGTSWDATLDYYFEPVGNISVGWFKKTIKDFIVSGVNSGTVPTGAANGFNGEYGGFTILTSSNAGTAHIEGWEIAYQQQLTFLPGVLKGLSFMANYTQLETRGDFGGTSTLSSGQVAGFIPKTGNVGLSYRYGRFSSRVLVNYTGEYITSYSAASVGRNLYRYSRTSVNAGIEYQLRRSLSVTLDVANPFAVSQRLYRGIPDQMQSTISNFTTFTAGIAGRF